jgi:SAM-dependent methyltransferase
MIESYDNDFYKKLQAGSLASARAIVPLILEWMSPKSVVDVGCGVGGWLKCFKEAGVPTVLGLDGDYVPRDMLHITATEFVPADLSQPIGLDQKFDLVMSLEVAEHLPESASDQFVDNLSALGDTIIFGAAVPGQGGTKHENEQWQSYWATKFEARGFSLFDCLRPAIWNHDDVKFWYKQNTLIFSKDGAHSAQFRDVMKRTQLPINVVHPEMFAWVSRMSVQNLGIAATAKWLGREVWNRLTAKMPRQSASERS